MDSNPSPPRIPRARIIRFLLIFSMALLTATWFGCATWNHFWKTAFMPVWQIVLQALTLLFVATTILARRYSNFWLRLGYRMLRNLARDLELQLFRGRHGLDLFRGGSIVVVSYRAEAHGRHIFWSRHGHEHLRPWPTLPGCA